MITTTVCPPPIRMYFNRDLLSICTDYWELKQRRLNSILRMIDKRKSPYGNKKTQLIEQLVKEYNDKYERSMVAKEEFETKKKTKT